MRSNPSSNTIQPLRFLLVIWWIISLSAGATGQREKENPITFDHHVHFFSEALIDDIRAQGYALTSPDSTLLDIDYILDINQAERMVLVAGGYAYSQSYLLEKKKDRKTYVMAENDSLAAMVDRHPERLLGFYGLNPLESFSFREMKRCHEELNLDGLKLHFHASRINLRKHKFVKKVKKLFSYAAKNDIPILLHLKNNLSDFGRGDVELFVDNILEAIPPVRLILAHMGGDGGFTRETVAVLETFINYFDDKKHHPDHQIYFELSGAVIYQNLDYPGKVSYERLAELIRQIGLDRVVYGSDYPVMPSVEYRKLLKKYLPLEEKEFKQIFENTPLLNN